MIPYEYPDIFTGTAVQKELLITDGTVTVTDDEYTVSGETIKFETGDFELESFELSQSLMSEMQFTYGCCETGKVRFIVRKHYVNSIIGVELKVYIIPDHDASKMLQLGVFKVNEDKQSDNYNVHSITAYDAMYDILNEDVTDWYNDILEDETSSVTLATFRTSFISFFGLTTESASEPLYNDDLVLRRTIEKDQISGAEIIKAICELNGCFGVINNVGEFRYKGLPPSIIHDASTLVLDVPDYMDIQFEDTSFKPIKAVKIVNDGVSVTSSQTATGNYNTYTIAYNPLIANYSQADLQSLANDLCDLMLNHSYLPCSINAIGNPVHEVGDCLEVNTKYGFSILTYIFERTLKGIQALRDTYRSNGVEYLTENLNKQSTQTKAVQSQVSQMAQAYANSDTDFVETIRNIGFRLLDEPSNVSVEFDEENQQVEIKWTDPSDISTNEPVPCTWAGTVVVRKEGSAPRHRWDGTLITDSTTRDEYSSNALIDDTIEINKAYVYGLFPYHVAIDDQTNPIKHYRYTKCLKVQTDSEVYYEIVLLFDYTGNIQEFTVPIDGLAILEVWGAQGSNGDGLGGYAYGEVSVQEGTTLYICVGGQGEKGTSSTAGAGGYNGGGDGGKGVTSTYSSGGGGATHIAKTTNRGELKNYENTYQSEILIVAGGGGGCYAALGTNPNSKPGSGGGFEGKQGQLYQYTTPGGTQNTGYAFGLGETGTTKTTYHTSEAEGNCGGGGGLYGGRGNDPNGGLIDRVGGGGSGFINTAFLTNAYMYGYNVPTSDAEATKTYTTTNHSSTATKDYAKEGNGSAKITFRSSRPIPPPPVTTWDYQYTGAIQTFNAPLVGHYKLELWGAQGGGVDKVDNNGSYGGYACAEIDLLLNEELYIGVGGQGGDPGLGNNYGIGGYNGGGDGGKAYQSSYHAGGGGGGATHIATTTNRGELKNYSGNTSEVLIVAGGGGGCCDWWDLAVQVGYFSRFYVGSGGGISGGHGDSYQGTPPSGGTQSTGYAFGLGKNGDNGSPYAGAGEGNSGGGGGWYGGEVGDYNHNCLGAGGSGYIGNSRLSNKHMAGFEVTESSDTDTATTNVAVHSSTPTADTAKEGNGHVRITWLHY